jgi:hypothetical protein
VEEGKKREETGAYFADEASARTLTLLMRRIGVEEAVAPGCSRGRRPAAPRAGVDLLLLDLLLLGRVSTCCSSGGCRPAAPRAGIDGEGQRGSRRNWGKRARIKKGAGGEEG